MSTTVLPELAAESVETAKRLVRLSAEEDLDAAEADYILWSGLAAIERVARLWPIIRGRIGAGMPGPTAHEHLSGVLTAVDKNLALAAELKNPVRVARGELRRDSEAAAELAAAEQRLRTIQAEAIRLLKLVEAPARWPAEEQLREAKERMRTGELLSAEEFRQALLD
jgi:hypothetical protein